MSAPAATCAECSAALPLEYPSRVCAACLWGESAPAAMTGAAAMRVPGHEIIEEIARGGMGVVYRAREHETHRTVALKMLRPRFADETGMRERFRLEARAVAALEHPSILPVYRVDEAGDMPFFTMKLAAGGTLAARRESLRGQWREIAALLLAMSDAVQYAHQHGVLHRDLKPANVLFDDAGRPYLSDFGLVKLVDAVDPLSGSQNFLGTPHYASPEVASINAGAATVASDVWSLGAMLYELLAGRTPFDAPGIPALLRKIVEDPASTLPGGVPRNLATICLKCLSKAPDARYASAGALADDLRRWLDGRPILARPASSAERLWQWAARNPVPAALTAALMAALGFLAFSIVRESRANAAALLVARDAEGASRIAEAEALLAEARATRRANDITRRDEAIAAVRRSAALHPSTAARDELVSLLALPGITQATSIPYARWNPRPDGNLTRYVILDKNGCSIRDLRTQREIARVPQLPHPDFPPGPLSPDGQFIALRRQESMEVWDIASSRIVATLPPLRGTISFSGDRRLVSLGPIQEEAGPSVLCDLHATPPTVRKVTSLPPHWCLSAISPDGAYVVAIPNGGAPGMALLDTATLSVVRDYPAEQTGSILIMLWSADSRSFFTGSRSGTVARWPLDATQPQWSLPAHESRIFSLALTHNGRGLASLGNDGLLKFWDLATLSPRGSLPWPGLSVFGTQDGGQLLAHRRDLAQCPLLECTASSVCETSALPASWTGNVYSPGTPNVFAAADGSSFAITGGHHLHRVSASDASLISTPATSHIDSCALDPLTGGCFVLVGRAVTLRPSADAAPIPLGTVASGAALAFDPHSRRLLSGTPFGFRAWSIPAGGTAVTTLDRLSQVVVGVSGQPGLRLSRSVVNRFAPVEVKAATLGLDRAASVTALAWSPSGRLIAWAGTAKDKTKGTRIVEAVTTHDLCALLPGENVTQLRFTADEVAILAGTARELICCDAATGTVRWRIPHQRTAREPIRFAAATRSPRIAAALAPDSVSLLDPNTGTVLLPLTHPVTRTIRALDLSPDGTRLCVLAGTLAQVWKLDAVDEMLNAGSRPDSPTSHPAN